MSGRETPRRRARAKATPAGEPTWIDRLERPAPYAALVALLVVATILVRVPLVFAANDVFDGHADSGQYFHKAYTDYLSGRMSAMPHSGSGWQLLLALAFRTVGIENGTGLVDGQSAPADAAQAEAILFAYGFHAIVSAGVVVATFILARLMLRPIGALAAAAFVAIDPFLLTQTTANMADSLYAALFVFAIAAVVKARDHPAWLALAGALMAGAHMLRVNGLVMTFMVVLFAALYLPRASDRFQWRHLAIPLAVFALVAAPYLIWRAQHLPGAFDYGTNQRFFADDLWAESDPFWDNYTLIQTREGYIGGNGPRETIRDYFATHTLGDAFWRLYHSVQWQVFDLVGAGSHPDRAPEGAALTPVLAAFALVGALWRRDRRDTWALPLAILFTVATFVWIYPVVRSVRYLMPVLPLASIVAVMGIEEVSTRFRRPMWIALGVAAGYLALYAIEPLAAVPAGLRALPAAPLVMRATLVVGAVWLAIALAPLAVGAWRRRSA